MDWQPKAVIFDFNGVIVNDEPLHAELMRQVLAAEGVALSEDLYHQLALGVTDRAGFAALLQAAGREPHESVVAALIANKTAAYQQTIQSQDLFFPGVTELIKRLALSLPLALVSGALRAEIETTLSRGNLSDYFKTVIASEDVTHSKPHPEGFLKALAHFNQSHEIQAADCLVIEDSVAGVQAAKRAGMKCLAVTTSYSAEKLVEADWILAHLTHPIAPLLHLHHNEG